MELELVIDKSNPVIGSLHMTHKPAPLIRNLALRLIAKALQEEGITLDWDRNSPLDYWILHLNDPCTENWTKVAAKLPDVIMGVTITAVVR